MLLDHDAAKVVFQRRDFVIRHKIVLQVVIRLNGWHKGQLTIAHLKSNTAFRLYGGVFFHDYSPVNVRKKMAD